jgi:hypothetical protein
MTVYELVEKLGGEIVRGYARVRVGQDYVVIGRLNGDNMDFTEEGRQLAAAQVTEVEPKRKGRKQAEPMVESDEVGLITEQE